MSPKEFTKLTLGHLKPYKTLLGLLAILLPFTWWMSIRLETPEGRRTLIREQLEPVVVELKSVKDHVLDVKQEVRNLHQEVEDHCATPGHPVMEDRMNGVKQDVSEIKGLLRTIRDEQLSHHHRDNG